MPVCDVFAAVAVAAAATSVCMLLLFFLSELLFLLSVCFSNRLCLKDSDGPLAARRKSQRV
jgi:hypothetical protein